jgi:O-succinylbenzoic acid--CoA ligase
VPTGDDNGLVIPLPDTPAPELAARVWELVHEGVSFAAPGAPVTDAVDVVLQTSGTSVAARSVGHTYAAVGWAAAAGTAVIGAHRWLLLLSPVSAGGFMVVARSAEPPLIWPGLGGRFDARAVAAWNPHGATATSVVSTQLARLLDAAPELLRSLDVVLVGGGPFHPQLQRRCAQLGINAIGTYGATETLGGCVYDGVPLPGVDVELIDEEIHIGGPHVARSYVPGPAITQPWATGDLGRWHDGRLQVLGRRDDRITVKGVNRHLREFEQEAMSRPGVVEAVAVAVPDVRDGYRVEVFVEDDDHRLPRLATGKPDRQELLRRARGDSR